MTKGWWRPAKVAEYMGCSRNQVYAWLRQGELIGVKVGGYVAVSQESIRAFEERHMIKVSEVEIDKKS